MRQAKRVFRPVAMSTASKLTLLGTTIGTIGIVAFVHWAQTAEKAVREPNLDFLNPAG